MSSKVVDTSLTQSSHSKCERENQNDFHQKKPNPKCVRHLAMEILGIESAWAIENCSIVDTDSVVRDVRILRDLFVSATVTIGPFSVWCRCHCRPDSSRKNHVSRTRTMLANSKMNRLRRILNDAMKWSRINIRQLFDDYLRRWDLLRCSMFVSDANT